MLHLLFYQLRKKLVPALFALSVLCFFHPAKVFAGSNPVIYLKGDTGLLDTFHLEQGYPYSEPGDSAYSSIYGNLTSLIKITIKKNNVIVSFSNLIPGTYVFYYNVTDAAGNKAVTRNRVVTVTPDKTPPNLIIAKNKVTGTDTIYYEVSTALRPPNLNPPLRSYVISAIDLVDNNLTSQVVVDSSLVQLNVVGIYPVVYSSEDLSKNVIRKTLYVEVIDTIKPVITLKGPNPDTSEIYVPYTDAGITLSVSNGYLSQSQLMRRLHVTGTVNDSVFGTYKISYTLTDTFGNIATPVTRIVVVADKLPPVLSLKGPVHDSVAVNTTYIDPGYTVSDNYSKGSEIKVTVSGTFIAAFGNYYANRLGGGRDSIKYSVGPNFRIVYTATDSSGNKSTATRYIEVYDHIAPVMKLTGPEFIQVCQNGGYIDNSYTLSDNYDDSAYLSHNITRFGTYKGTLTPGLFYVHYAVHDHDGNTAFTDVRHIEVVPSNDSSCQAGIIPNHIIDTLICNGSCRPFTARDSGSSYKWNTGDAVRSPQICINSDTALSVTITKGNYSVSYLYNISVTPNSCVWPGDANGDGNADNNDLLPIGVAFGETGSMRPNATLNWTGQPCADWVNSFKSGLNVKNADCNGDGIVDSNDVAAILKNYGVKHKTNSSGLPSDPPLSITFSRDSLNRGDTVTASVTVGSSANEVFSAYGLAFSLPYNRNAIKSGKIKLIVGHSWLGTPGANLIYLLHNDTVKGTLDIALTRIDHKNVSGYGEILKLNFSLQDSIGGIHSVNTKIVLAPTDINLISDNETLIPLYGTGDTSFVRTLKSGLSGYIEPARIKIYPNPASQTFFIDGREKTIKAVKLVDELGRQVYFRDLINKPGIIEIPVSGLTPGIYSAIVYTQNGVVSKRIFKK